VRFTKRLQQPSWTEDERRQGALHSQDKREDKAKETTTDIEGLL
jgi:hypothetical protein